jgi:hypothetical protein
MLALMRIVARKRIGIVHRKTPHPFLVVTLYVSIKNGCLAGKYKKTIITRTISNLVALNQIAPTPRLAIHSVLSLINIDDVKNKKHAEKLCMPFSFFFLLYSRIFG